MTNIPATSDTLLIALHRALAIDGATNSAPPALPAPDASMFTTTRLREIIELLLTDPTMSALHPPGVTKGRIAALLAPDERRYAETLMRRLDHAGVLAEPRAELLRWREPRPFRNTSVDWIIDQVVSTQEHE